MARWEILLYSNPRRKSSTVSRKQNILNNRCRYVFEAMVLQSTQHPCIIHLAVPFPDVVTIESDEMFDRTGKSDKVVWIKGHNVYAANTATWVIEIRLIVVVDKNIQIKSTVPTSFDIRRILPFSNAGIWTQRIVCF